jgi:hypothetical protein
MFRNAGHRVTTKEGNDMHRPVHLVARIKMSIHELQGFPICSNTYKQLLEEELKVEIY